jgi:hypothetical protein
MSKYTCSKYAYYRCILTIETECIKSKHRTLYKDIQGNNMESYIPLTKPASLAEQEKMFKESIYQLGKSVVSIVHFLWARA